MSASTFLTLKNISKSYSGTHVLKKVNLSVKAEKSILYSERTARKIYFNEYPLRHACHP